MTLKSSYHSHNPSGINGSGFTIVNLASMIDSRWEAKQKAAIMQDGLCDGLKVYNELVHLIKEKEKSLYLLHEQLKNFPDDHDIKEMTRKREKLREEMARMKSKLEFTLHQSGILESMLETRKIDLAKFKKPILLRMKLIPHLDNVLDKEGEGVWNKLKDVESLHDNIRRVGSSHLSYQDNSFDHNGREPNQTTQYDTMVLNTHDDRNPPRAFDPKKSEVFYKKQSLDDLLSMERRYRDDVVEEKSRAIDESRRSRYMTEIAKQQSYRNQMDYYEEKKKGLLFEIGKIQKILGNNADPRDVPHQIIEIKGKCDYLQKCAEDHIVKRDELLEITVQSKMLRFLYFCLVSRKKCGQMN